MTKKTNDAETKVQKQRRLMKNIEIKLNAYDEVTKIMQKEFLPEFGFEKIKHLINSQNANEEEKSRTQVLSFSRMLIAEQSFGLLLLLLNELITDLDELKDAVYEKQGGGPKVKKERAIARKEWIALGLKEKRLPRPQEILERVQFALTGSQNSDENGEYAVPRRTLDDWTKGFKIDMVNSYIESKRKVGLQN